MNRNGNVTLILCILTSVLTLTRILDPLIAAYFWLGVIVGIWMYKSEVRATQQRRDKMLRTLHGEDDDD